MEAPLRIGLIGDHDRAVTAHRAIPVALRLAGEELDLAVAGEWLPTPSLETAALVGFAGFWCVPASPYRSEAGALRAIRFAREQGVPFLGTCGGFQHALIEYARHVLGWADAAHAESDLAATRALIVPLACPLVETSEGLRLRPGSRLAAAYGRLAIEEDYHCRYGLDPAQAAALLGGPLGVSAESATGGPRAVELEGHPFFVATLFQPERRALAGEAPPLVLAFLAAVAARGRTR